MVRRPERRDMFINDKILRRLMVRAYKGAGVYMGHFDGHYHIQGAAGAWEVLIIDNVCPKTILSQMVECSGRIPEEGESWTADKEKDQMAMYDQWPELTARTEILKTPVVIQSESGMPLRVMQLPNEKVMLFREELVAAIDPTSVNTGQGEEMYQGPFYDGGHGIFAKTNHAVWHILESEPRKLEKIKAILESGYLAYDMDEDK